MVCCKKCRQEPNPPLRLDDVIAQVGEVAASAKEAIVPRALDARDRLIPLALDARDRLVPLAGVAADRARPIVEQARDKVADVVATDVIPRLSDLRERVVPLVVQTDHVEPATVAAIAADVAAPRLPKRHHHPILKSMALAVFAAGAWLIIKTLMGSRDDGWELQEPDAEPAAEPAPSPASPVAPATRVAPAAPVAPAAALAGSYRGARPPAGYKIKANERSMKYHVPTAIGYRRLVTDLWFESTEAAERAGFTRALR